MTPEQFVSKWRDTLFRERQGSQPFFEDLCAVVGHPSPSEYGDPDTFAFEMPVTGGRRADAYFAGHFVWEFKSVDRQLDEGMRQAITYAADLRNPPLLIASSFNTIRIRTNFRDKELVVYEFPIRDLGEQENLDLLKLVFFDPDKLEPQRTVHEVTSETSRLFYKIVADMEQRPGFDQSRDPERLARYLNQIVFCLFAEDARLLRDELFTQAVMRLHGRPADFDGAVRDLFDRMASGGRLAHFFVDHFNGDLFDGADTVELSTDALLYLVEAAKQSWASIEPSIFGTLFERALDASKRSQLGAHYTGASDIELVVEPVVIAPLRREWEAAEREVNSLLQGGEEDAARSRLEAFQQRLASVTVLDPACGSGNFLYIALRSLLDLEKRAIDFGAAQGWYDLYPRVKPSQMLGLEINPYAAELARTALWIGYIQWHDANGIDYRQRPILTPMDTICRTDAILADGDTANPRETEWPAAEFIIGNPPFLGGGLIRQNLGDEYTESIFNLFGSRIPNFSDICCYWFEKAREMLATNRASRCGLLATQGIRGGANRQVLQRIKESGDIFAAYSDRPWVLEGAAVHVSIVCFDDGTQSERKLNGESVPVVNSNLTAGVNTTLAQPLEENSRISFIGPSPKAPFDITPELAIEMLDAPLNVNGRPNSDVVRPVMNARDITQRPRGMYTIDFGVDISEKDAAFYEAPFEYIRTHVKPVRIKNRRNRYAELWWMYAEARPGMRRALSGLSRYIATPRVSKYRLFVWIPRGTMCNDSTDVFAFDDDYSFGVLHSRFHEVWALALGTQLEDRPRYTPTTCFETFPFPEPDDGQRAAIAEAARKLNELREQRLKGDPKATLTGLYNRRPAWLANAHADLDAAVTDAYGWPATLPDAEILERLLALNLQRSSQSQEK